MIRNITVGIDIGTQWTRVVVAEHGKGSSFPTIIGTGIAESRGLRHGYVTNSDEVSESVVKAVRDAEKQAGIKVKRAYVAIGGISLGSETSVGSAIISRADKEVTQLDTQKAGAESEEGLELVNKKIIHSFPIRSKLDGKEVLGRPEGMKGIKLEVKTLFITCLEQHLNDLVEAVTDAGVEVTDIIASPIAVSALVLNERQKTAGCVLVDIGAETVSMAVFEEGTLMALQVFPIGSTDITKDIALGFKISLDEAENIKTGAAIHHEYPKKKLDEIIEARLGDIFELVENQLKKMKRSGLLPAGAIIVGGGSHTTSIEEMAKAYLKLPAKVGAVEALSGTKHKLRDASWFAATGLTVIGKAANNEEYGSRSIKGNVKSVKKALRSLIDQFLP